MSEVTGFPKKLLPTYLADLAASTHPDLGCRKGWENMVSLFLSIHISTIHIPMQRIY